MHSLPNHALHVQNVKIIEAIGRVTTEATKKEDRFATNDGRVVESGAWDVPSVARPLPGVFTYVIAEELLRRKHWMINWMDQCHSSHGINPSIVDP